MIINFFEKLLFPLEQQRKKTTQPQSEIEKYILAHNPQSLADVERLQKQFVNDNRQNY